MTVLFYTHPSGLGHDTGPGHPERPERLEALLEAVEAAAIPGLERREAGPASLEQIHRVHPGSYAEAILARVPREGHARLDPDTVISPGSGEAALHAAGAACAAVDAVLAGEARRAFCAMRPPGHHAEPARANGFCLFNNVAIAALQAREIHGVRRIAILDFDVHHGNGTQAAFWDDPQTLFVSTHQWPLFPGTGAAAERGVAGNILNLPLASGTGSQDYRELVSERVLPAIDAFAPELVLLSAGFDAHRADPLASLSLVEEDFAWITSRAVELATSHAKGRVVSVLEGGYDTLALARSTVAHLQALADA
ncbi:histone deacetylase family protein [Geminicoccaceae bacterium 1502E]|nr:histone deacetylase family protein [Geminicoccaceae bacterium 1502E]